MPDSNHVDIARRYANDGTKAFLDGYDAHAAIAATAERLGDLVLTTSRMRLDQNGDRYVLQHSEIVTGADA